MALSLLLLGGVIAIFASSRVSYETNDKLARIQENGRFALDQLVRDIRSAGFVGCARAPTYVSTSLNNSNLLQWNFLDGPVRGFQATDDAWDPALDASLSAAAAGSDVLVLRIPRREAQPLRLTTSMASGTDALTVPAVTNGVRVGDIALAYSCEAQAYFQVTSFAGGRIEHASLSALQPGNSSDDISYAFRENAEVIPVQTVAYFVAPSTADANATSLWRRTALNNPEELVEGIERMELQFGLDTNGDSVVDQYVTADAVDTNWASVFSVRVALLVRSLQEYGADVDRRQYQVLDAVVPAPADRRLREVFTATANLRNRVPVN